MGLGSRHHPTPLYNLEGFVVRDPAGTQWARVRRPWLLAMIINPRCGGDTFYEKRMTHLFDCIGRSRLAGRLEVISIHCCCCKQDKNCTEWQRWNSERCGLSNSAELVGMMLCVLSKSRTTNCVLFASLHEIDDDDEARFSEHRRWSMQVMMHAQSTLDMRLWGCEYKKQQ